MQTGVKDYLCPMADYPKAYLFKRLVQAKLFIDQHFAETLDLNNIADEAIFSKFHFIRLFKSVYGKTPHQYLIYVRIENAKKLLQTGASIAETCDAVGFESTTSFTGLFKKLNGVSPSAYRDSFAQRQEAIKNDPLQFIPNCFAENKGWSQKSNSEEAS
jgi:AraC-like DNA-binding protein